MTLPPQLQGGDKFNLGQPQGWPGRSWAEGKVKEDRRDVHDLKL